MTLPRQADGRFHQLNGLRAAAALMVVGYHCELTIALPKYVGQPVLPVFRAGHAGVQLFFVLSGFVIYLAHRGDPERSGATVRAFLFKRFRRLYPALWVVLALVGALAYLGLTSARPSALDFVAAFLILPVETENLLVVEWTLRHEVLFYAVFCLFLWRRRIGGAVLVLWGVGGAMVAAAHDLPWLAAFLLSPNHLLFLAGMGVAHLVLAGPEGGGSARPAPSTLALGALVLGALVFGAGWWLALAGAVPPDAGVLVLGAGACGIIYGLCRSGRLNVPVRALDAMGAASYALYLIHYPLIALGLKAVVAAKGWLPIPHPAAFAAIVILCQVAALGFHRWVERPLIRAVSGAAPAGRPVGARAAGAGALGVGAGGWLGPINQVVRPLWRSPTASARASVNGMAAGPREDGAVPRRD